MHDTLPNPNVLIVDDLHENLLSFEAVLNHPNVNIVKAQSGNQALEMMLESEFALVLLDVQMPGMDGFEVAEAIKSYERTKRTPILFVTAISREINNILHGYGVGATDYLVKPIEPEILRSKVNLFVDLYRHKRALENEIRKREIVELELRRNQARYRRLVESNIIGVVLADMDGIVHDSNDAFLRIIGRTQEELRSKKLKWTELTPPEFHMEDASKANELLTAGVIAPYEKQFFSKNNQRSTVLLGATMLEEEGQKYICWVLDLSKQKELEMQLLQSQKMDSIGRLAGGVAHDFNNLLMVISGYSELALNRTKDEDLRGQLEEIRGSAHRAAALTRQLLAFSRKQMLQPVVLNLNDVVSQMDKMLRRLIGEDIDLVTHMNPKLDKVKADPGQIEQIVMNLAVNARDAMPKGGKLTLETDNVELDEDYVNAHVDSQVGPHVVIAMTDTGTGMDAATQEKIFEPFYTTKGPGKGTGLGLSTVYGIVKQSGGNIWVYSEPGLGTTFKIYLPRVDGGEVAKPSQEVKKADVQGTETILLVEDETAVRGLLNTVLTRAGYKVLVTSDAEEALATCKKFEGTIHMLLTDVVLPGAGGREVAKNVKELRPDIRVVYMSGYTDDAIVRHGVLEPGVAFIEKPIAANKLLEKIREFLG